ncbi:phenylacetate--CoA ligase [Chitinispirillales bacterium ANBcel5]|uniref:phenylacetate--CoA ligase family protein n=1 Tax=Cellulosispirillum alkaliphilum TaxID=3039283 RepID=UPI002A5005AE|nr:phenylacetate--CoA ligase [Chitinispirillales bacterium ANBcel5]
MMDVKYWNKEKETIQREALEELQLKLLRDTVDRALKTPFYRRRLGKVGIKSGSEIKTLEDIKRIPYTTKDDLREAYPFGLLSCDIKDSIRLHTSSGTTGIPTVIYHSRNDIDTWTDLMARCFVMCDVGQGDVFQNMASYGLFTGGLGFHYGAERVGALVIPSSSGNTRRQLSLMRDFGTTVVHATPSYLLHLTSQLECCGVDRAELKVKKAFMGAEPYSEETRLKVQELLQIKAYNSYGLSEMNGPGVAFECVYQDGMHVWEDSFLMEIIDPLSMEVLGEQQEGEIVFTTLRREATPLLRYRTRDLSYIHGGMCKCGRTHRRIARIKGRSDDMLIINGVNVFPSQIEEVIMGVPEVGTNYQILVKKQGQLDRLTLKTEIYSKLFTGDISQLDALKRKISERLKASITINPVIELHEPGGLPVSEGKAKRVFDERFDS